MTNPGEWCDRPSRLKKVCFHPCASQSNPRLSQQRCIHSMPTGCDEVEYQGQGQWSGERAASGFGGSEVWPPDSWNWVKQGPVPDGQADWPGGGIRTDGLENPLGVPPVTPSAQSLKSRWGPIFPCVLQPVWVSGRGGTDSITGNKNCRFRF